MRARPTIKARPTIIVEGKVVPTLYPCVRGHLASTAIELYNWIKKIAVAKAKVLPHLEAWVRVGGVILHAKDFVSLSALSYSKE
jgi:hypothetical protein